MFKGTCDVPIFSRPNEKILQRKESKVLGILIDEELSFDKHLSNCKNSPQQKWNQIKLFIYKGLNASTWAMIAQWSKEPVIIREVPSSTQYTDTTTNNDNQRTSMLTTHCISKMYVHTTHSIPSCSQSVIKFIKHPTTGAATRAKTHQLWKVTILKITQKWLKIILESASSSILILILWLEFPKQDHFGPCITLLKETALQTSQDVLSPSLS